MPICATNPLNRLSKWPKYLPKTTPTTEFFVHSEGSGGNSKVLNPSILTVLIQFWVVGLRMLSAGQYLAHLTPNLFITRPHIAISEELLAAHNRK